MSKRGDGATYGPFIEVRSPVCRQAWCAASATREDGLCDEHGIEQDWMRTAAQLVMQEERERGIGRHNLGSRATGALR